MQAIRSLSQLQSSAIIAWKQSQIILKWTCGCVPIRHLWTWIAEFHAVFIYHKILFFFGWPTNFKSIKTILRYWLYKNQWGAGFGTRQRCQILAHGDATNAHNSWHVSLQMDLDSHFFTLIPESCHLEEPGFWSKVNFRTSNKSSLSKSMRLRSRLWATVKSLI